MHMIFYCLRPTFGNFPPRRRVVWIVDCYVRCWQPSICTKIFICVPDGRWVHGSKVGCKSDPWCQQWYIWSVPSSNLCHPQSMRAATTRTVSCFGRLAYHSGTTAALNTADCDIVALTFQVVTIKLALYWWSVVQVEFNYSSISVHW